MFEGSFNQILFTVVALFLLRVVGKLGERVGAGYVSWLIILPMIWYESIPVVVLVRLVAFGVLKGLISWVDFGYIYSKIDLI
jgi:hypothetical protein